MNFKCIAFILKIHVCKCFDLHILMNKYFSDTSHHYTYSNLYNTCLTNTIDLPTKYISILIKNKPDAMKGG